MARFLKISLLINICFVCLFPVENSQPYRNETNDLPDPNQLGEQMVSTSDDELYNPVNWVARGGCWDFSKRIIQGQGIGFRPIAYYKKENFSDFTYEINLKSLSEEDGSYGLLFRFDEKKDAGYIFSLWPHGDYEFCRILEGHGFPVLSGPAVYLNDQLKTWNSLKVLCKGNKFELYLNGYLVAQTEDNFYKSGKIGFYLGHGPQSIIQFEIRSLVVL